MSLTNTEPQSMSLTFAASHEAAIAQSLTQIAHGLERLEDQYEALMIAGATTGSIVKNRLTHRALQARYTQKTRDWHAAREQLERARIDAGQIDPAMPYIVQERAVQYCGQTFTHTHHPVISAVETSQWPDGDLAHTCWVCSGCRKPLGEKTERIDAG